jgi:hypothetical protein
MKNPIKFSIVVDGNPLTVSAEPYLQNDEQRFNVTFNQSDLHIFAWDASVRKLVAIDTGSENIPYNLEEAISSELEKRMRP